MIDNERETCYPIPSKQVGKLEKELQGGASGHETGPETAPAQLPQRPNVPLFLKHIGRRVRRGPGADENSTSVNSI